MGKKKVTVQINKDHLMKMIDPEDGSECSYDYFGNEEGFDPGLVMEELRRLEYARLSGEVLTVGEKMKLKSLRVRAKEINGEVKFTSLAMRKKKMPPIPVETLGGWDDEDPRATLIEEVAYCLRKAQGRTLITFKCVRMFFGGPDLETEVTNVTRKSNKAQKKISNDLAYDPIT